MLCQQNHFCHFSWTVVFLAAFPVQTRCAWTKVPRLAGRVIFCYQSFSKRGIYSHQITLNLFYTWTNMVPIYYRNAPRVLVPNQRNNKLHVASFNSLRSFFVTCSVICPYYKYIKMYFSLQEIQHLHAWTVMDMAFICEQVKTNYKIILVCKIFWLYGKIKGLLNKVTQAYDFCQKQILQQVEKIQTLTFWNKII